MYRKCPRWIVSSEVSGQRTFLNFKEHPDIKLQSISVNNQYKKYNNLNHIGEERGKRKRLASASATVTDSNQDSQWVVLKGNGQADSKSSNTEEPKTRNGKNAPVKLRRKRRRTCLIVR